MEVSARLSSKGQVTVPRAVREALSLNEGDRVVSIATHNEPWVSAVLGYERGVFAPGVKDRRIRAQLAFS